MKSLKTILGIALATAGIGGSVAVGAVSFTNASENVEIAEAASNKTFYLDCTSFGEWDSESICIGTWNGSVNTYTEATKATDNYWYITIDITGLSGVEFYRCKAGDVNTRWNKSPWNTNCTHNYCSVTEYNEDGSWKTVSTDGWSETYEVASTTSSTSTKRIWLDPKDNFYDGNARAALRTYVSGGAYLKTYLLGGSSQYENVSGQTLFYVDIPIGADCQLVRLYTAFNYIWTYGGDFSEISGYDTSKVVYSWNASAQCSAGNEESSTVAYAKKVLDGYSTCEASTLNGYGNYSNIKTNVLDKLSSSDLSIFRSSTFSAPGYGTRTYGDKMDLMASKTAGSNTIGKTTNSNSGIILVVVCSTVLASAG